MEPTKLQMPLARAVQRGPVFRSTEDDVDRPADVLGTLEIRFAPFNIWYEIRDWWEGEFLERIAPGAFRKTIRERGPDGFRVQFDHGYDPVIGSKLLGPIRSITEAEDSPVAVVDLLDTSYNRDLLPGLRRGLYGSSFRFEVIKERWDDDPGTSPHNPRGLPERTILEVRLYELGPVTWPANPSATAGMRSLTAELMDRMRSRDPEYVTNLEQRVRSRRRSTPAPPAEPLHDATPEPHNALHGATARRRALDRALIGL